MIHLTDEENDVIKCITHHISADPTVDPELFCIQAKENAKLLPENIKIAIRESFGSQSSGHVIIRNIHCDDAILPITPSCNNQKIGEKTQLARFQSMLISLLGGELIAYEAEGYGRLFQDVVPIKQNEDMQISVSSKYELEIHTEQAFSKWKPDILSLGCLKGDPNAYTYILPVRKILDHLSRDELDTLYKPLWKIGVDLSFKLIGIDFIEGDIRGPIPILYGSKDDPRLVFDQDLMEGITPEANLLVEKIVDIYYTHRISHNLKPGEIVLINNHKATHGRSPFTPKYDGTDRFLTRCFGIFDYKKSEYVRLHGTRIVSAMYS
jgi:L-asparagine oxygenase